ncbi:MAG: hypothetical protein IJ244_07265 [Bacteroidaceae bacterium]|nr:hypothetical protein [Bacteroidaceae bacterium]
MMKRNVLLLLVAMFICGTKSVEAQISLTGRTYHNENIMGNQEKKLADLDAKLAEQRATTIVEKEKEIMLF